MDEAASAGRARVDLLVRPVELRVLVTHHQTQVFAEAHLEVAPLLALAELQVAVAGAQTEGGARETDTQC